MTTKISNIYKSILSFSGMFIDEDGSIYGQLGSNEKTKTFPKIDGKPLVFPCDIQFKDTDQDKIYFHPLCESFLRGESEVVQLLRTQIALKLNYSFGIIVLGLLNLLGSPELHKKLNQEQTELLKAIKDADANTATNWSDLMFKQIKKNYQACFIKIHLRWSGTLKGKSYSRLGIVSFPFYQDLINNRLDDQNIRVKDRAAYRKIVEFVIPNITNNEEYNYGTLTKVAPFLNTLMMTSVNVASRLNHILDVYGDYIEEAEYLRYDLEWLKEFEDMENLRTEISKMPELKGNIGVVKVQDRIHPGQNIPEMTMPPPPTAVVNTAAQSTQNNSSPVASNVQAVQQYQQPVQQPQYVNQQPMMPVQEQPSSFTDSGKVKFNAVMQANPLMMHQNPLQQQMPMYAQPQQQRVPLFAMPLNQLNQQPAMYGQQPQMYPVPMNYNQGQQMPQQMVPNQLPPGYQYVTYPNGQVGIAPIQQQQPQPLNTMQAMLQSNPPPPPGWQNIR